CHYSLPYYVLLRLLCNFLSVKHVFFHCLFFFFSSSPHHRHLHSFPTRRSSDLSRAGRLHRHREPAARHGVDRRRPGARVAGGTTDRKSTRLNSSHQIISYAVFCLKKKKHSEMLLHSFIQGLKRFIISEVTDVEW